MSEIDNEVGGVLERFNNSLTSKKQAIEEAVKAEDEWVAAFDQKRKSVIRPTMEALGEKLRAK